MDIIIIIIVVMLRFQSTDSWLHRASGEGELPSPQHAQQGMCDLISLGVSENVHCVAWLVLSVRKSTWLGLTVSENVHFVAWLDLSVSENVHFVARLVSLCQKLDLKSDQVSVCPEVCTSYQNVQWIW